MRLLCVIVILLLVFVSCKNEDVIVGDWVCKDDGISEHELRIRITSDGKIIPMSGNRLFMSFYENAIWFKTGKATYDVKFSRDQFRKGADVKLVQGISIYDKSFKLTMLSLLHYFEKVKKNE